MFSIREIQVHLEGQVPKEKSGCDLGAILVQKSPYLSISQTKKALQKEEPWHCFYLT